MKKLASFLPLAIIILLFTLIYQLRLMTYLNYSTIKKYHLLLASWVDSHYLLAILLFCICYIAIVATAIPATAIGSLVGGFLFGNKLGTLLIVVSATVGASCLFLAVKLAFGDYFLRKIGVRVKFMEEHFHENAFYYLLGLRLLPIAPFFLVNLAAGIFAISFKKFVSATFIGIIPGSFVYANIGASLISLFTQNNDHIAISKLLSPQIITALALLGVISVIPIIIKNIKRNKLHGKQTKV